MLSHKYFCEKEIRYLTLKISNKLRLFNLDREELQSIGNFAWTKAAATFDERRGVKFCTYLWKIIWCELMNFRRSETRYKETSRKNINRFTESNSFYIKNGCALGVVEDTERQQLVDIDDLLQLISNERSRDIVKMYSNGYLMREIALKYKISKNRVQQLLNKERAFLKGVLEYD